MLEDKLDALGHQHKLHSKVQDKKDRATVENVIDPRTRLMIYKMVRSGFLAAMHGCISTGKEANVYFAILGNQSPAAIKIYRTSVLIFRDRDMYVKGDFRFQRYSKNNPRKMVQKWAEKEARNLRRLEAAGISAPRVLLLKQHILVMSFLGRNGWPFPRLQDVGDVKFMHGELLYQRTIDILRKMYLECNIVHGDFSEFNLLLEVIHENDALKSFEIHVIDVSQSVEPDHPNAMEFLRRDIGNVQRFFADAVSPELSFSAENIFLYVTGKILSLEIHHFSLHAIPDTVFKLIPIPRTLASYAGSHDSLDVEKQYDYLRSNSPREILPNPTETQVSTPTLEDQHISVKYDKGYCVSSATKVERKEHKKKVKLQNRERRIRKSQEKSKGKK